VALAEMTGGKWLTCDKKAHQKIQHLHLSHLLG
jgi:predicted nucleic acid-binding protein